MAAERAADRRCQPRVVARTTGVKAPVAEGRAVRHVSAKTRRRSDRLKDSPPLIGDVSASTSPRLDPGRGMTGSSLRGSFRPDERLELLGGQLVVREPQGSRHAVAIELAHARPSADLRASVARCGCSLPCSARGRVPSPSPDLSVVAGDPRASTLSHPAGPFSSSRSRRTQALTFDREQQGRPVCARRRHGLLDRQSGRPRAPGRPRPGRRAPSRLFGWQYGHGESIAATGTSAALARPVSCCLRRRPLAAVLDVDALDPLPWQ